MDRVSRVDRAVSKHEQRGREVCQRYGHRFLRVDRVVRPCGGSQYLAAFQCEGCGRESRNHYSKVGPACQVCGNSRYRSRRGEDSWRARLAEFGHTLLHLERDTAEYKAVYLCGFCGSRSKNAYQDIQTASCRACAKHFTSFNERSLADMMQADLRPNQRLLRNDRTLLGGRHELDIVLEEGGRPVLAVEWNGTYWHSLPNVAAKDRWKVERTAAIGVRLIVVSDPAGPDLEFVRRVYRTSILPAMIEERTP